MYPESYIAEIELKDSPNKFCGRNIRNKVNQAQPSESIEDCTCVYIGSRGQTLFNFTISIKGNYVQYLFVYIFHLTTAFC